jgi:hypothetical protein
MTVFEFIQQFFFQNDIYQLQEVFSEHGIRVFLVKETWKLTDISYLTDLRQTRCAKTFQKQF